MGFNSGFKGLTAIGLSPGGSTHLHTIHRTTQITTEQHKDRLMWKSAGRVPSVSVQHLHGQQPSTYAKPEAASADLGS